MFVFFFSSRRRHTRCSRDWSSDVCSSDLPARASAISLEPPDQGRHTCDEKCPAGRPFHRGVRGRRQGRTSRTRHHAAGLQGERDRKSTRLNSSHGYISYAVFCLKKKKKNEKI